MLVEQRKHAMIPTIFNRRQSLLLAGGALALGTVGAQAEDSQTDWRFCQKCNAMFFDGAPDKGHCPAGGAHVAQGFIFQLPHDGPLTPTAQADWRFCNKCFDMFFDGFPNKGRCAAGGAHVAQGFNFHLPHDVPGPGQASWRFCQKCNAMFYDGAPNKGSCPAGGGHLAQGYNFVLPFTPPPPPDTVTFDPGALTVPSPLAVQGHVHVLMRKNGDFTFSSHVHNAGAGPIHYTIRGVLVTATGIVFTFEHSGHCEGTSNRVDHPFSALRRDDSWAPPSGHNPMITREFDGIAQGAVFKGNLSAADKLAGSVVGALKELVSDALQSAGKSPAATVIELLAG